jgi:hypothetical protein
MTHGQVAFDEELLVIRVEDRLVTGDTSRRDTDAACPWSPQGTYAGTRPPRGTGHDPEAPRTPDELTGATT